MPSRQPFLAIALLCLAPAAVRAQCTVTPPEPAGIAAEIVSLTGRGETRPREAQPWSAAFARQQLATGADLRTLALSSAAVLLADRTQIRMAAGSLLRLCDTRPERTRLQLDFGRLWARTKKAQADLELQTPAALAGIRGTDWDVEVDAQGRTTLTVLSGEVELSNAQGRVTLGPAEQGYAEPGRAPVKRLLAQPRERVQWVARPVQPLRWAEWRAAAATPALAPIRADLAAGEWARARERLLSLESQGQGSALVQLVLADLEVAALALEDAQRRLAAAWMALRDPRLAARRAELLALLDRGDEARRWLDAALAEAPAAPELLLADADWQRREGRAAAAEARYRAALAATADADPRAAAHAGWGDVLLEQGDLHAARAQFALAVALAPDDATYQAGAGTAAAQGLRLPEARAAFEASLALVADDYVGIAGAGLLSLQQGDPETARRQLLKAALMEPRYARAHVALAATEARLGETAAARDALERARAADPNDPLPWQVQAILLNDGGAPADAIAASREALRRLPFLKSLNALQSDSQGSANLGKALGDFGLEHWARAYAQASYDPLWAGSHFFLADRYESDFSRRSELFQGYLADPTVFGASEKRAPILPVTGREWSTSLGLESNELRRNASVDLAHRGLQAEGMPVAWLLRLGDVETRPRAGPPLTQYRLTSPGVDLALGARPTDRLGVFATYAGSELRTRFPQGLDLGNGITVDRTLATRSERIDAGAALRWSADSQTWLKLHRGRLDSALVLDDATFGPQDYDYVGSERGVFVRHTTRIGPHRLSAGWERVARETRSEIRDALIASPRTIAERYDMPWLAAESRGAAWSVQAEWYRPQLAIGQSDRFTDLADQDLLPPAELSGGHPRRWLQRYGASRSFGPGRAVHVAYQENVRAPGTYTLSPVATGAIPVDHEYQLPGSFARKKAVQLDWEAGPDTFFGAAASVQTIANPVAGTTGRLFTQNTGALFDNVGTLAPPVLSAQSSLATYQETPVFAQGRISLASVSLNQVLAPRWSVLGSYVHAATRNTGEAFRGHALPGFPRSTVLGQSTWRHRDRSFSLVALTWRGARYRDEANLQERPAGWNLGIAHAWESPDRRWRLTATASKDFSGGDRPTLFFLVRYRD